MTTNILEIEKLCYQTGDRFIVNHVNWQIKKGEQWVLFGLNGCGKTTLLSIISGFRGFTGGKLKVFGEEYSDENILSLRKRIGFVSSSFFDRYYTKESALSIVLSGLSGTLSVDKNITNANLKEALDLLNKFALFHDKDKPLLNMSKGERQKVYLARALISNPELLILDEPTTGLDICARQYVQQIIDELVSKKGIAAIYVTHYPEEIMPVFNHAVLMRQGRFFANGYTDDIFTSALFSEFLSYPIEIICDKNAIKYDLKVKTDLNLKKDL